MRIARRLFAAGMACLLLALGWFALDPANSGDAIEVRNVDPASFATGSTMHRLAARGAMTVGTKFDQPLLSALGPDGKPQGFDVEIATIIAAELGIKKEDIVWVRVVSADRERVVANGQVDLVIATYTITPARKAAVDFAGPYYMAGQAILVVEGNRDIEGPQDLHGRTVCTTTGSTSADVLRLRYPEARLRLVSEYTECLEPLRNGQIDAISTDNAILSGLIHQNPGEFEMLGQLLTTEPYGIAVHKGDTQFRSFINDVLERSYANGSWRAAWERTAGEVLEESDPPAVNRY